MAGASIGERGWADRLIEVGGDLTARYLLATCHVFIDLALFISFCYILSDYTAEFLSRSFRRYPIGFSFLLSLRSRYIEVSKGTVDSN